MTMSIIVNKHNGIHQTEHGRSEALENHTNTAVSVRIRGFFERVVRKRKPRSSVSSKDGPGYSEVFFRVRTQNGCNTRSQPRGLRSLSAVGISPVRQASVACTTKPPVSA